MAHHGTAEVDLSVTAEASRGAGQGAESDRKQCWLACNPNTHSYGPLCINQLGTMQKRFHNLPEQHHMLETSVQTHKSVGEVSHSSHHTRASVNSKTSSMVAVGSKEIEKLKYQCVVLL